MLEDLENDESKNNYACITRHERERFQLKKERQTKADSRPFSDQACLGDTNGRNDTTDFDYNYHLGDTDPTGVALPPDEVERDEHEMERDEAGIGIHGDVEIERPMERPPPDADDIIEDDDVDQQPNDPIVPRRSERLRRPVERLDPTMSGQRHHDFTMLQEHVTHPDTHLDHMKCHVIMNTCCQQYSMNSGLKLFGDVSRQVISKELEQLHLRKSFTPVHYHTLGKLDRKQILESHLFLGQKRDLSLKAQMVAGGDHQQEYMAKEDVGSPTCETKSLFLSATIDAIEQRDVAMIDMPNAFVQMDIKGIVHIRM